LSTKCTFIHRSLFSIVSNGAHTMKLAHTLKVTLASNRSDSNRYVTGRYKLLFLAPARAPPWCIITDLSPLIYYYQGTRDILPLIVKSSLPLSAILPPFSFPRSLSAFVASRCSTPHLGLVFKCTNEATDQRNRRQGTHRVGKAREKARGEGRRE